MMAAADVEYVLGVDMGTTSIKVVLVDSLTKCVKASHCLKTNAAVTGNATEAHSSSEQDLGRIVATLEECVSRLPRQLLRRVVRIGVCGQMHGVVLWRHGEGWRPAELGCVGTSNLITWQDGRCTAEFLSTLPVPDSHLRLSTGHGCATLFWLARHRPSFLARYDRSGTVQDFVVAMLCGLDKTVMSIQNAASWGYVDTETGSWNVGKLASCAFPVELLPAIVSADIYAGKLTYSWFDIPQDTPVGVALGDMQCSVRSALQTEGDAVLNISTSAQLSFISPKGFSPQMVASNSAIQYFPYFAGRYLAVAASLNGGNVLAGFVHVLQQWTRDLGFNVPEEKVWDTILSAVDQDSITTSDLTIIPTLFGERHLPEQRASVLNVNLFNISLGSVTQSICKGIINNICIMMTREKLTEAGVVRIVGTGSALLRNCILQKEVERQFNLPVAYKADIDAALGVALAMIALC